MDQLINDIKGIGPKTRDALTHLEIRTDIDLLNTFPKSYTSYFLDEIHHIKKGVLISAPLLSRHRVVKVSFKLKVEGRILACIAYQQAYLKHVLVVGESYLVRGKYDNTKKVFIVSQLKPIRLENQLVSQYHLENIPDFRMHHMIKHVLQTIQLEESLPHHVIEKLNLLSIHQAYQSIHLPKNEAEVDDALKRFKVEEIWHLFQHISSPKYRHQLKFTKTFIIEHYLSQLPFQLSKDQKEVLQNLLLDVKQDHSLRHLIQGDVGSGKTVIAILLACFYIQQGYQVAFMVPTEILARQHAEVVKSYFPSIHVEVLTSSVDHKKTIETQIQDGDIQLIIGTHILASQHVVFQKLGLVIIDEQQKFGVDIRKQLIQKALDEDVIYLTATPIPRTLLRSMLGDVKVYQLLSRPEGRQPIKTISVSPLELRDIMKQLQLALLHHQHCFVVVPAIDSDHVTYNVMHTYHLFKQMFSKDVYVLHGQMSKTDQHKVMETFKNQPQGILISTQMIEVGVDIKTATFMLILEADYFGLAQLHQLRGRLGRGHLKGVCYLISNHPDDERFKILETTSNGFDISQHDLYTRGPGDMLGLIQSGMPPFKHIDYVLDAGLIYDVYALYIETKQ